MLLTADNYYSPEANREYLSCSQYEDFLSCEAAAMAKLDRRYIIEKESDAFFLGHYFHTYFEGPEAFKEFCEANFDRIYKTKTTKAHGVEIVGKYAPIEQIDQMIATAEAEPAIKRLIDMPGENEAIMTGKLFGEYPWRIRLDKYIPSLNMIIDWKTVANIGELEWSTKAGQKVSFVENFNYLMRAAVYIEIEKQFSGRGRDAVFWLVCLSKQTPPDKEIVALNDRQRLDVELEQVYAHLYRIQQIKLGEIKPRRCGRCEYCRGTKKLTGYLNYYELEPVNRPPLEEEYEIPGTYTRT